MTLPFGLDLKTIVITVLFMWFALPWLLGMLGKTGQKSEAA